jgi:hypothetical protein
MSTKSNPFNSPLVGILLQDSTGDVSLDIFTRNTECEYHRLELTESLFDTFPSGVLIVRDKADFISRLSLYGVSYITFLYENGNSDRFRIHATSHVNNAASATEETYVAVHFSNYLYFFCQENSLSSLLNTTKPKVVKIDQFFTNVASAIGAQYTQGMRINDATDNYVCYRPLNPKLDGTEVGSDNVGEYLNYLANYAVPLENGIYSRLKGKPRFVFWTDWGSYLNLKCISSVTEDIDGLTALNTYNLRYAIYSGDVSEQKINGTLYKKLYNYSTNQGLQYITKQYYYVRKTPKLLDGVTGGNTYANLAYQFLDEGLKYNIQLVGNTSGSNGFEKGAQELEYPGMWGYIDDGRTTGKSSPSTYMSGQYGLEGQYKKFNLAGMTATFPFIDNGEMWKNVFDLTPLDPYYPTNTLSVPNPSNSNLQKVLDIKYNAAVKLTTAGLDGSNQLELIRKVELQNFVMYSLCCMGQEQDDSFFAILTSYNSNPSVDPLATGRRWIYGWNKINFAPHIQGGSNQIYTNADVMDISYWKLDPNIKSASTPTAANVDTYAINLNESGNTGTVSYSPGWIAPPSGFKYRPVGLASSATVASSGPIYHFVKMYKKSWQNIFATAGVTLSDWSSSYDNKFLYYFIAENVVDGTCV